MQEHGPVILASGGFGADFTASGLLAKYRPDLLHLPTTNGPRSPRWKRLLQFRTTHFN